MYMYWLESIKLIEIHFGLFLLYMYMYMARWVWLKIKLHRIATNLVTILLFNHLWSMILNQIRWPTCSRYNAHTSIVHNLFELLYPIIYMWIGIRPYSEPSFTEWRHYVHVTDLTSVHDDLRLPQCLYPCVQTTDPKFKCRSL